MPPKMPWPRVTNVRGIAPCGTGLIISGLAMADMLVEFDVDVVIPA